MARVKPGQYRPVEVDLWADSEGALFDSMRITRSLQREVTRTMEQLDESDDPDQQVEMIAAVLDLMLKAKSNQRRKPSSIVAKKWESDDVTIIELLDFVSRIGRATRPT